MSRTENQVEYVVRVKFPEGWLACKTERPESPEGLAVSKAIFDVAPPGFEICWRTMATWPTDNLGYTWVPLWRRSSRR
jgi:hypothetical protein